MPGRGEALPGTRTVGRAESPVRLSDLAAELGLDVSTVRRHVRGLETEGYPARTGHPGDRRETLLALTAHGEAILTAALAPRGAWHGAGRRDPEQPAVGAPGRVAAAGRTAGISGEQLTGSPAAIQALPAAVQGPVIEAFGRAQETVFLVGLPFALLAFALS